LMGVALSGLSSLDAGNRAYGSCSASQSNSDIDVDALREIEIGTGGGGKRCVAKNGEHGNPCQVGGSDREEVDQPGLVVTDQTNHICPIFLSSRFSYRDLVGLPRRTWWVKQRTLRQIRYHYCYQDRCQHDDWGIFAPIVHFRPTFTTFIMAPADTTFNEIFSMSQDPSLAEVGGGHGQKGVLRGVVGTPGRDRRAPAAR